MNYSQRTAIERARVLGDRLGWSASEFQAVELYISDRISIRDVPQRVKSYATSIVARMGRYYRDESRECTGSCCRISQGG